MSELFLVGTTFFHLHQFMAQGGKKMKMFKLNESVVIDKQKYDLDGKPLTRQEIHGWYCPKCTRSFSAEDLKEAKVITPQKVEKPAPGVPLPSYEPGKEMK